MALSLESTESVESLADEPIYGDGSTEGPILGTDGDDIIYAGTEESPLENTGDNFIVGGLGDDIIYGGDGNDQLFGDFFPGTDDGSGGDDIIYGGDGNDFISGDSGNDTLYGEAGDDILLGGEGDDTLVGGEGNDQLVGGPGNDTFVFSFTLTEGSSGGGGGGEAPLSFVEWLGEDARGLGIEDLKTQSDFAKNYTHWLEYLVKDFLSAQFGIDENAKVDLNQNDPAGTPKIAGMSQEDLDAIFGDATGIVVKTGKVTHTRYWSDLDEAFDWGGGGGDGEVSAESLWSGDGHDFVWDFEKGADRLQFTVDVENFDGSSEALWSFFQIVEGEFGGNPDAADTRISLKDGSMSITLVDASFGENDSVWDYVDFVYV